MPGIKDISDLISDLSANKLSNLEELKLREVQNMIRQAQEGNLEFFNNFRKPDDAMKFYAGEGGQKKLEEFQSGDWGKQFTDEDKEEIYQSIMDQRSGGMLSKLFREMDAKIDVKGKGMADINRMTAPLGYAAGGPASITALEKRGLGEKEFDLREDIVQKTNEMISYLNKRVGEQSFGAGPAAEITNYLTEERRKENPDYDRLNEMYLQYSGMPDFKDAQVKEEKGMGEKIMKGLGELFGGRGAVE